jgi:toxin ParE1/3/4
MARLRYATEALSDLEQILRYLHSRSGSLVVAIRFTRELRAKCRELAASPFSTTGRARPELQADLRSVAHKGYIIFFRQVGDVIEVVNVLEGHRDMGDFYSEDG